MHKTPSKFLATKLVMYQSAFTLYSHKNSGTLTLLLILKRLVTISAAQAHKLHIPSVQYPVLDHRLCFLSVQLPPHTLDQLAVVLLLSAAVLLLSAAVGRKMT